MKREKSLGVLFNILVAESVRMVVNSVLTLATLWHPFRCIQSTRSAVGCRVINVVRTSGPSDDGVFRHSIS